MRDVGHELGQIDVLLHPLPPDRVVGPVDLSEELLDRRVERGVGVELVRARLEQRLVARDRAEILGAPWRTR